jgi:hypothetical protein
MKRTHQEDEGVRSTVRIVYLSLDSFIHQTHSDAIFSIVGGGKGGGKGKGGEDGTKEHSSGISYWETLVLFTVNFTKLNVHMNMGNVMGNVK